MVLGVDKVLDPCYARQAHIRLGGFLRVLLGSIQRIILNKYNTSSHIFLPIFNISGNANLWVF